METQSPVGPSPVAGYPLEAEAANSAFGTPPPSPDTGYPPTAAPKPHQGWKTWLAGGLAAAVFGVGGFFGIQAVTSHAHASTTATGPGGGAFPGGGPGGAGFPGRGGTFGTVKAITGSTLTLTAGDGSTVTVTTSSATTVTKAAAAGLGDIAVDDHVTVRAASGGLAADQITDTGATAAVSGPGGPRGNDVTGTVAAVGNGTITVTESGGSTVTVTTSSATSVTVIQPGAVSALAAGDSIRVTGTTTNGIVAATSIESGVAGFGPGGGPGGGPGPAAGFGAPPSA